MISKLLSKSSIEDIRFACEGDWKLLKDTVPEGFDFNSEEKVSNVVSRLYGASILEKPAFRELFLQTLSRDVIFDLADKYKISKSENSEISIIRILASKPWGSASKLLPVFKRMGFDESYLPIQVSKIQTSESVQAYKGLPELFDYQSEIVEDVVSQAKVKGNRLLLHLPTGSGKTRVMMESITSYINSSDSDFSILWLAHSEELLEQAISSFKSVWSAKGGHTTTIHRLYGQHFPNELLLSNSIIFASLQKLSLIDFESSLFQEIVSNTTHIIVDETHKITAQTYKNLVNAIFANNKATLIGVTATPGRNFSISTENRSFARFFNDNLITPNLGSDPISKLQEMGVLSKIDRRVIDTSISINDDTLGKITLKRLGRNKARNDLLMIEIQKLVSESKPTLVFSCSTSHSRLLAAGLVLRGIKAAFIDYTKSSSSRRSIIDKFRCGEIEVLVNFGVLSTGFDAPEIQALVIARPTTSLILYSQMIGRGLRGPKVGGNQYVTVVDIKDNFDSYGDLDKMYNHFSDYWR